MQCVARGVRSMFFFRRELIHRTISRVFSLRRGFRVVCSFSSWRFWSHCLSTSGSKRHELPQLWVSLCRYRFGVFSSSKFGRAACRVPRVTRACAACNAIIFSFKKTGRRSKLLGYTFQFEDSSSSPGKRFYFFSFFFFFRLCFSNVGVDVQT